MLPKLLNLPRARELMAARGLDGLVVQLPINVYYLSGYWGFLMNAERFDAAYFAVLPRQADRPGALVLPALELRRLIAEGGSWVGEVQAYSSALDDESVAEAGIAYEGWPVRPGAPLTELEQRWVATVRAHRERVASDALHALARAMRAAGLVGGEVLSDDPRVGGWLEACGVPLRRFHYDGSFLNEIRKIKTTPEINIMREAARINETALHEAAGVLQEGATWSEVETAYLAAMARRGARGSYCISGVGGLPAGRARRGEPILLDALGTYRRYHGDFGRCAVIGEPGEELRRRHAALCAGWDSIQPLLRPGTRYSELAQAAVAAIRGHGFPEFRYATPHGLGLEHTDDPKPVGVAPGTKPDQVLEPGMVLNVDMPFTEIGWGSVHLEDTVLVTERGFERLTSSGLDILQCGR
jgi:Xaa-Pro aminopeptidase